MSTTPNADERLDALELRADEHDRRTGALLGELSAVRRDVGEVSATVNYHSSVLIALAKGLGVSIPPPPKEDSGEVPSNGDARPYSNGDARASSSDLATAVEQAATLASKLTTRQGRTPKEWAKLATGVAAVVAALATLVAQLAGALH